jgi:spermidine/putrescine transport system permease protein
MGWLAANGSRLAGGLVVAYLFVPVVVIVAFSLNSPEGKFNFVWKDFSLDAWADPFQDPGLARALVTSLEVASLSTVVAVLLATPIALALVRYRFRGRGMIELFLVLPLTTPEVVLGSSLLTMFLDLDQQLGFTTIVLAHIMFQVAFAALTVRARIGGFDWALEDAAMDLGASPARAFRTVTLPLILPGVIAAAVLSFALSLDDVIITFFTSGNEVTYPLYVDGARQRAFPPQINVLATMLLVVSLGALVASTLWASWRLRGSKADRSAEMSELQTAGSPAAL